MKIVIACPPIRDFYITKHRMTSLGTEVLRQILSDLGCEVRVLNFSFGDGGVHEEHDIFQRKKLMRTQIPLPDELEYLMPYIVKHEIGPVKFFTQYYHWGPDFSDCAKKIYLEKPDILCISSFAYAYAQEAVELSRHVKLLCPELFILAGGAGPTVHPRYYLEESGIDAVLSGEGGEILDRFIQIFEISRGMENKCNWLLDKLLEVNLAGLYLAGKRNDGNCHAISIAESKPVPAIVHTEKRNRDIFLSASISRGCPRPCCFCSTHLVHGTAFRKCSIESIERVLSILYQSKRYNHTERGIQFHFNFEDDNLLLDPDFLLSACQTIRRFFPGATFSAENGLDYNLLPPSLADRLIHIGFNRFNFSFVSADQGSLNRQARSGDSLKFTKLVNHIASQNIPVVSYFIAGFVDDTRQSVVKTIKYLSGLPTRMAVSPYYAVPGTTGFEDVERFLGKPPRLSLGTSFFNWNDSLSTRCLITIFRLSRIINLAKNKCSNDGRQLLYRIFTEERLYTLVVEKGNVSFMPVPDMDDELVHMVISNLEVKEIS